MPSARADRSDLRGERDGCPVHADEPVARERGDGLGVELGGLARRGRDEAERGGAALAERALERPLLAERLVAPAARGAGLRERAGGAAPGPPAGAGGAR